MKGHVACAHLPRAEGAWEAGGWAVCQILHVWGDKKDLGSLEKKTFPKHERHHMNSSVGEVGPLAEGSAETPPCGWKSGVGPGHPLHSPIPRL